MEKRLITVFTILRVGVAFSFIYAAVAAFITPTSWIGYFPAFLLNIAPESLLLGSWGIVEIVLALWLIFSKSPFIPASLMTASLAGLIVFNIEAMDIIFRDITIATTTLALAVWYAPKGTDKN